MQYTFFGDVVTFDITYHINLYDMFFGLFVGVDNHFQSVILAGVLVRDETVQSFEWMFSEFLRLMGGVGPKTALAGSCNGFGFNVYFVLQLFGLPGFFIKLLFSISLTRAEPWRLRLITTGHG